MIISVNWLKQFTDITLPIDELTERIGARLVEIEEVIDLGERYKDVVVAKVMTVKSHPSADRLHVVEIDDGGKVEHVERLDNNYVQVVCGAPNVTEGMLVAWLPPRAIVPQTFTDPEPFQLEARKLRGVISNGMLASAQELAVSDDHEGIVEIDKDGAKPGDSFAELYELNDHLLDIENKSLTHRPDCFGLVGFAREVAAIQGSTFTTPAWLNALEPKLYEKKSRPEIKTPTVTIGTEGVSARYEAVVLAGVSMESLSPLQIQSYLSRVGMRPINAVVDITNYLMLVTGQPLHAFDYDKFIAVGGSDEPVITIREAKAGEKLVLLDKREIELASDDIVICSGDVPVALAGAMGGASTEVSDHTKNILLESATFDLYRLRMTQMRHGIFSEAITRFTKGQPAPLTAPVLASAIRMMSDIAGAERATDIVDVYPGKRGPESLKVPLKKVQQLLGAHLSIEEAVAPLEAAEFSLDVEAPYTIIATPPYWRADIHIVEDVIEEIGRIRGFDSIAPTLPQRDFTPVAPSEFDQFRTRLREQLARAGGNEVLTFSFVHGNLLRKAEQSSEKAFRITNALSPDLQYYRLSMTPSLLDLVHPNLKQRFEQFALFEMGKVHEKGVFDDLDPEVPAEFYSLAAVVAASQKQAKGAAFYEAKYLLNFVCDSLGLEASYHPYVIDDIVQPAISQPFEARRTAVVRVGGQTIGLVGEYKQSVAQGFKLPDHCAGFEIDLVKLFSVTPARAAHYAPMSRFPGTEQDICVQVPAQTPYQQVIEVIEKALADETLEWHLSPVDIYQPKDAATKNVTIRISLTNHERTISTDEASIVIVYVSDALTKSIEGAKIV